MSQVFSDTSAIFECRPIVLGNSQLVASVARHVSVSLSFHEGAMKGRIPQRVERKNDALLSASSMDPLNAQNAVFTLYRIYVTLQGNASQATITLQVLQDASSAYVLQSSQVCDRLLSGALFGTVV